jgi:acetyl-CoA C-acetyltransferase
LARFIAAGIAGVDPTVMGIGPVPATRKALGRCGLTLQDMGRVELNEAFAAQTLAVARELGIDMSILNVNGGAIALGHPLGCSGARIVVTLLHEMARKSIRYGLATICIAGGMGMSTIYENLQT